MSVSNFLRQFHRHTNKYANQDPTTEVRLGAFGELRGSGFVEYAELEDFFDDYGIRLRTNHEVGHGAGLLYTSGRDVTGTVTVTGKREDETAIKITDSGVTQGGRTYRSYSGKLTLSFQRRHSYLFACSNYVHEKLEDLDTLQANIVRIFNDPGREWRKSMVLVGERTYASRCSLLISDSSGANVTWNVVLTADDSARIEVGKKLSLEQLQNVGVSLDGGWTSSSGQFYSVIDDDGACVPTLGYLKLKGQGNSMRLFPVK